MPASYPYDLTSPPQAPQTVPPSGGAVEPAWGPPPDSGDSGDAGTADFGVDILQDRCGAPLIWHEVTYDGQPEPSQLPIAVLRPGAYIVRLTNNSQDRVVARVSVDGQALKCLYRLAPRSKHTVKGRRISSDELLPFNFQTAGRSPRRLARLDWPSIISSLGSVEVKFYRAEEVRRAESWRGAKQDAVLRAWASDAAASSLQAATTYGIPESSVRKGGSGSWRPTEELANATVYLIDPATADALGLAAESPRMQQQEPQQQQRDLSPPGARPPAGRGANARHEPRGCAAAAGDAPDAGAELRERLRRAEAEAELWRRRFEELRSWVDAHLRSAISAPQGGPAGAAPGPRGRAQPAGRGRGAAPQSGARGKRASSVPSQR